jgi:predicted dehydrogenase
MLKLSIIGAGENAAGHARYYAESERVRVTWVFDPVAERAASVASICGARVAPTFEEALDGVDAVVIASPNPFHPDQAVAAAEAGRHVFIEKPMALRATDARRVVQAVARAGVKSCVGFATRFTATIASLTHLAEMGTIGELHSLWARRMFWMDLAKAPAWRRDPARSGGVLMEINVHELDWLLHLGGPPLSVYSVIRTDADITAAQAPLANDDVWFTLRFQSGCVATHEGSWATAIPNFYRGARGSAGGLATDEWGSTLHHYLPGQNRTSVCLEGAGFDLRGNWLDSIEGRCDCVADAEWGAYVTEVADAILTSAADNSVVRLDQLHYPRPTASLAGARS